MLISTRSLRGMHAQLFSSNRKYMYDAHCVTVKEDSVRIVQLTNGTVKCTIWCVCYYPRLPVWIEQISTLWNMLKCLSYTSKFNSSYCKEDKLGVLSFNFSNLQHIYKNQKRVFTDISGNHFIFSLYKYFILFL